jgi:hypothetical protein
MVDEGIEDKGVIRAGGESYAKVLIHLAKLPFCVLLDMQQERQMLLAGTLFYGLITLLTSTTPFFWDTILTSTIAHWFYDHGTGNLIVPEIWDAGHPPFFQLYLTGLWKIFEPSLSLSHWAMFPFLMLMVYSFSQLACTLTENKEARWLGLIFLLLHPHVMTQSTLVSYDVLHVAFFLTALLAGLKEDKWLLALAVAGLAAISLRGQITGISLVLVFGVLNRKNIFRLLPALIASLIFTAGWHGYHYHQTGWMISTPSTTWEGQRGLISLLGAIDNAKGIIRGLVDYGALMTTVLGIGGFIVRMRRTDAVSKKLLIVTSATFLILVISLLPFSNPIAHRYFLSFHSILALLSGIYIIELKVKKWLTLQVFIIMLSGHWWLYPERKSNGWDVTMAHYPYHQNRSALFHDLEHKQEVASAFPLFCSLQQTDLLTDNERLKDISQASTDSFRYVAWSRVCNDMRDIDLKRMGEPIKVYGKGPTSIRLYSSKIDD